MSDIDVVREALRRLASYEDMAEVEWQGEPPNLALAAVEAQVQRLTEERARLDRIEHAARELHHGFIIASDVKRMQRLAALTVALEDRKPLYPAWQMPAPEQGQPCLICGDPLTSAHGVDPSYPCRRHARPDGGQDDEEGPHDS